MPIHDFGVGHKVCKVCSTQSVSEYCIASFSAQAWQYRNRRKPEVGTLPYSNTSVFEMPLYRFGDDFIFESTTLKMSPAWSLAATHTDMKL